MLRFTLSLFLLATLARAEALRVRAVEHRDDTTITAYATCVALDKHRVLTAGHVADGAICEVEVDSPQEYAPACMLWTRVARLWRRDDKSFDRNTLYYAP